MQQIEYKEFINKVLNMNDSEEYVQEGIFDNFYAPFLDYMRCEISTLLNSKELNLKFNEDEFVESVLCSTKESLIEVGLKTLITEFYDKKGKGLVPGNSSKEIYESYNNSFNDYNNIKEVLSKYEVLAYLFYRRVTTKYILLKEAITRLSTDLDELKLKFNADFSVIKSVTLDSGDTHNDGKSVVIFNFDKGERVVYKPHGLFGDEALKEIYNYVNSKEILDLELCNVDIINKESYGWQKFVEYGECKNKKQAEDYYYRIGTILAILNILKTIDIHSENIIAASDIPVLIDLETLLTNDNTDGLEDNIVLAYLKEINDSVLNCYLLPQNIEFSKVDIDMGGLSADPGAKSQSLTYLQLKDMGTDRIRFEKEFVVTTDRNNKPMLNGERLHPIKYINCIEKGFKEAYSLILRNKDEFFKVIDKVLSNGVYRQVLRPTYIYGKYLEASYHPKYLKSFEDRNKLFNILKECDEKTYNNNNMKNIKCLTEIEALMKDDIPYFSGSYLSKEVFVNNNDKIDEYFSTTIRDTLKKRIEDINEVSMNRQLIDVN